MDKAKIFEFYNSNKAGIIGAFVGFTIAILILLVGIINFIFISVFTTGGYFISKKLSKDKEYIKNLLDRILPPGSYK